MEKLKLIHTALAKDEAHCIGRMLDSVLPYVDESYILIDDRTTDDTMKVLEQYGCNVKVGKFENFGKFKNMSLKWVSGKSDWIIGIAPDETMNPGMGTSLREIISKVHNTNTDSVFFSRIHWKDLDMKQPVRWRYPDWQQRLLRNDYPRIHATLYVHEYITGIRKTVRLNMDINHFNLYWKPKLNYNWEEVNKLYAQLQEKQKKDGGVDIWPSEDWS